MQELMNGLQSKDAEGTIRDLIDLLLKGKLTEQDAQLLYSLGPEAVTLFALAANRKIAQNKHPDPSTPSGQKALYTKPNRTKKQSKPGARKGHKGSCRPKPRTIDRKEEHRLDKCPDCGGELTRCSQTRTRTIEDIIKDLGTEAVEHTIHRDYCQSCKKHVEPKVPDALPKSTIGHRLVVFTSYLHYLLGVTFSQIREILQSHLHTKITDGGMFNMFLRISRIFEPWYEQIAETAKKAAVLHSDETGWRINGVTHWLWCFTSKDACYYMIDRSRGSPALLKFFTETFEGTLVTDFWSAYGNLCAHGFQKCLVHLLRELERVDIQNKSSSWELFSKKLRRLLREAIKLRHTEGYNPANHKSRIDHFRKRLQNLISQNYQDADATRLIKRLKKYENQLFLFLEDTDIPFENNFAERMIRPAVIIRKNSQSNRSEKGAAVQSMLMSIYRTLKIRGHDPMDVINEALRTYVETGQLPAMP